MAAGELVNELFLVVAGSVEVVSIPDKSTSRGGSGQVPGSTSRDVSGTDVLVASMEDVILDPFTMRTVDMGSLVSDSSGRFVDPSAAAAAEPPRIVREGQLFCEAAFFTEMPQLEVRMQSTCMDTSELHATCLLRS